MPNLSDIVVYGPQGFQGSQGSQGSQGLKGDKGDQGSTGSKGDQGSTGSKGDQGSQGFQGSQGYPGAQLTEVPANLTGNGVIGAFTAGTGGVAFGDVCYINGSGQMVKADATATGTVPTVAMALGTASVGNPTDFLFIGIARNDSWGWTAGNTLYLSETAGVITATAPTGVDTVTQVLGVATNTTRIFFRPSADIVTHV